MRFGFIQGVVIWEKDVVEVIVISPTQPLQLNSYSCRQDVTPIFKRQKDVTPIFKRQITRRKDYCRVTMHALHVKWYKIPYIHACVLFACTSSSSYSFLMLAQYNMSGSSVTSAVPRPLGSTLANQTVGSFRLP